MDAKERLEQAALRNVYVASTLRLIALRPEDETALLRLCVAALAESNERLLRAATAALAASPDPIRAAEDL